MTRQSLEPESLRPQGKRLSVSMPEIPAIGESARRILFPRGLDEQILNQRELYEHRSAEIDPWDPSINTLVVTISDGVIAGARLILDERMLARLQSEGSLVVAFYTPENSRMQQRADDFGTFLKGLGISYELRELSAGTDSSSISYVDQYAAVIQEYPHSILDMTGGTKLMSDGAKLAFMAADRPIVYLTPGSSAITHEFGRKGVGTTDLLKGSPAIEAMLRLDGWNKLPESQALTVASEKLDKLASIAIQDPHHFLRIQGALNKPSVDGLASEDMVVRETYPELLKNGDWLSLYVADALREVRDVSEALTTVNLESGPSKPNQETFDIDVAAIYRGIPIIFESKTSGLNHIARDLKDALDKLGRRNFADGKFAEAIVCPIHPEELLGHVTPSAARDIERAISRAKALHISLLSIHDFSPDSIRQTLERVIAVPRR